MSSCLFLDHIVIFLQVQIEDTHQFIQRIVREFDVLIEPAPKTRIAVDKILHRFCVACDDHDQVIPVILHGFQNRIYGFLTKVFLPGRQGVCLVNEQHTSQCLLDLFLGLQCSLSYITCYKS